MIAIANDAPNNNTDACTMLNEENASITIMLISEINAITANILVDLLIALVFKR